jgi:hypothetical protein
MFNGKFFHRDELVRPKQNDYTKRMQDALQAHREHAANDTLPRRGEKGSDAWPTNIWHLYGVKKASFYKAIKWENEHPGRAWSGAKQHTLAWQNNPLDRKYGGGTATLDCSQPATVWRG